MSAVPGIRNSYRLATGQSATSSTVLQNITDLSFPVAANSIYHVRTAVIVESFGSGQIQFNWAVSATVVQFLNFFWLYNMSLGILDTAGVAPQNFAFSDTFLPADAIGQYEGDIDIQTTSAGICTLQFAQVVSDPGATLVAAGSFLDIVQLK